MSIDTATGKEAPSELSSKRVYSIFSSIAPKYERFNKYSSFGRYRRWLDALIELTPADASSSVLDVAGGTGDVSFALAKKKHPAHIMLTDLVPEMLDIARQHIKNGAAKDVTIDLQVVDAQNMPFEDNSFDIVTMAYGIRNMPDRASALSEVYRVLKPNGTFACLEFSTPTNAVWRKLYTFYLNHIIPLWGQAICKNKENFEYLSKSIQAFPNQKQFATMLHNTGFHDVSWRNYSGGIVAIHIAKK